MSPALFHTGAPVSKGSDQRRVGRDAWAGEDPQEPARARARDRIEREGRTESKELAGPMACPKVADMTTLEIQFRVGHVDDLDELAGEVRSGRVGVDLRDLERARPDTGDVSLEHNGHGKAGDAAASGVVPHHVIVIFAWTGAVDVGENVTGIDIGGLYGAPATA